MKRVIEITIIALLLVMPSESAFIVAGTTEAPALTLEQKKIYQTDTVAFGRGDILEMDGFVIHLANVGALFSIPVSAGNKAIKTQGTGNVQYITTVNPFGKVGRIQAEGVGYWEYDNKVGAKLTQDSNGMQYYSVDGARFQSQTTSIQTATTSSFGISRSSTSSFKAWYEGKTYDDTSQETNGFVLTAKFRMLKGGREFSTHTMSQAFRAPMTSTESSQFSTDGVVKVFFPFGIIPRIFKLVVELVLSSVKVVFKFVQLEHVVKTWWDFPILNGIFHLNLKIVTSEQVKLKEYVTTIFEKVGLDSPRWSLEVI